MQQAQIIEHADEAFALINGTPLTLTFHKVFNGVPAGELVVDPFATVETPELKAIAGVSVRAPPEAAMAEVPFDPGFSPERARIAITPAAFPASQKTPPRQFDVVNAAGVYITLFRVAPDGTEIAVGAPLAPQDRREMVLDGGVHIARAVFTGELAAMVPVGCATPRKLEMRAQARAAKVEAKLRSPVPEIDPALIRLVGQGASVPSVDRSDGVVVAERTEPQLRAVFNARTDVATRTLEIAGVDLVWDAARRGLMDLQGEQITDLATVTMYADRVIIRSRLRFPGAKVRIHARRLIFEAQGEIDTTPIAWPAPARSPYLSAEGKPADASGTITYRAADGADGQDAGDIELFVRDATLNGAGERRVRFRACGTAGQEAEAGGLKDDDAMRSAAAPAPAVELQRIKDSVREAFDLAGMKQPHYWRWPTEGGEVRAPDDILWNGKPLFSDGGGQVIDLRMIFCDDYFSWMWATNVALPARSGHPLKSGWPLGAVALTKGREFALNPVAWPERRLPPDGFDAYAGGLPGAGGNGGMLRFPSSLRGMMKHPDQVDLTGGAAGPATAPVQGVGAVEKLHADLVMVNFDDIVASDRPPSLNITRVSGRPGANAPGRTAAPGRRGRLEEHREARPLAWMTAEALGAVIACARTAYLNEDRTTARALLDPYFAELDDEARPDLSTYRQAVAAMRGNLLRNVDYYGNPPGWAPRLAFSTVRQIFEGVRETAGTVLFFASAMEEHYDVLDDADAANAALASSVAAEMESNQVRLGAAYGDLREAQSALEGLRTSVDEMNQAIEDLRAWASSVAQGRVEQQRIFKGVMKIVGGLMKLFPVGQPFLGLGGDMVAAVGDVDWTDPDKIPAQISNTFSKAGGLVDRFLTDQKDTLKDFAASSAEREKFDAEEQKQLLTRQIEDTKTALAAQNQELDRLREACASRWVKSAKKDIGRLKESLAEVEARISDEQEIGRLKELMDGDLAETLLKNRRKLERQIEMAETALAARQNAEDDADGPPGRGVPRKKLAEARSVCAELRKTLKTYDDDLKAETAKSKTAEKAGTEAREQAGKTLQKLKGVGQGLTHLGDGIASLASLGGLDEDDADVKRVQALILNGDKKRELEERLAAFKVVGAKLMQARSKLLQAQQVIGDATASIAQNLDELCALSAQRRTLGAALDLRLKTHLRDMQSRAREAIRWCTYLFVMAYRYEYLTDVPPSFLSIDLIETKLRELRRTKEDKGRIVSLSLSEADVAQVRKAVTQSVYLDLAQDLLKRRMTLRARAVATTPEPLALTEAQRDTLRASGKVVVNLVRDFRLRNFQAFDARIAKIELKAFKLVLNPSSSEDESVSADLRFTHAPGLLLRRKINQAEGPYYLFSQGPQDDPVDYRFACDLSKDSSFRPYQAGQSYDASDLELSRYLNQNNLVFHEYMPSLFSDIVITMEPGGSKPEETLRRISKIERLTFSVTWSEA